VLLPPRRSRAIECFVDTPERQIARSDYLLQICRRGSRSTATLLPAGPPEPGLRAWRQNFGGPQPGAIWLGKGPVLERLRLLGLRAGDLRSRLELVIVSEVFPILRDGREAGKVTMEQVTLSGGGGPPETRHFVGLGGTRTAMDELLRRSVMESLLAEPRDGTWSDRGETDPPFCWVERLRYALEFTEPAFGEASRTLIESLVAMQDLLGEHQDLQVAQALLAEIRGEKPSLPAGALQALGELGQLLSARAQTLRREFPRTYKKLRGGRWRKWKQAARRARDLETSEPAPAPWSPRPAPAEVAGTAASMPFGGSALPLTDPTPENPTWN
jgi:hypothetical protein